MKTTILKRLLLLILTSATVIFGATIIGICLHNKNLTLDNSKKRIDAEAAKYANLALSHLNIDLGISRSLAHSFMGYKNIPLQRRTAIYNDILLNVLQQNPEYLSTWTSWELNAIEPKYTKNHGRKRTTFFRENNEIKQIIDTVDLDGHHKESVYFQIKMLKEEFLTDPYLYPYRKDDKNYNAIFETSVCVPIMNDTVFAGLAGIDIPLDKYQPIIEGIKPSGFGYAFMIANNGCYVVHPNKAKAGKLLSIVDSVYALQNNVLEKIKGGKAFSTTGTFGNMQNAYVSYAPIKLGKTSPWSLAVVTPVSSIAKVADKSFIISILIGVVGLVIMGIMLYFISLTITMPLGNIAHIIDELARGNIEKIKKLSYRSGDQIAYIKKSLNQLIDSLRQTAAFAKGIGEGDLDTKFKLYSNKDVMGKALLDMRQSLKAAKKEEFRRRQEDENRTWLSQGLTKFGDILRSDSDDLRKFCKVVITSLTKYIDAQVGAFYLINNDDPEDIYIQFYASYGYPAEKNLHTKIKSGENLVGKSVKEKETIYIKGLPANYMKISSGLGDDTPRVLLIVPLIFNEEIFGVVELASFLDFQEYQVSFVEKVGESIAATITNIKANILTKELLKETEQRSREFEMHEKELIAENQKLKDQINTSMENTDNEKNNNSKQYN